MEDPIETLRPLANRDGRYAPEAFAFLFNALPTAVEVAGKEAAKGTERHVSGQQLLEGMRRFALGQFGPLAGQVWRAWGVQQTLDWGRIVFILVEANLLNRQESDTVEDFREGFDFDEAFVKDYSPMLPSDVLS
jgi:uncharacterized repeat protein (TIGR04138 family)